MGAAATGKHATGTRPPRAGRMRLDHLVVTHGLAPSRHQAEAAIRAGEIFVGGQRMDKPGTLIPETATVERRARGPAFVSRGGLKLAAALDAFGVNPDGIVVLDVGASTGGFTDCVLQRGARQVYAVDVGRGQLHWRLRQDPRVVVLEGHHAARMQPADLPGPVDLATVDCSFISVLTVLPAVARMVRPRGLVLALVKPQFEAGPKAAPRGVVRDRAVHEVVLRRVVGNVRSMGLAPIGLVASPILGPDGNREFFVALRKSGGGSADELNGDDREGAGWEGADLEREILRVVYGLEAGGR
jgi:23S rRNA (cytidine1920-2'-O)/16S rRNA (cytidine1409-2'-O)-methyltransferase